MNRTFVLAVFLLLPAACGDDSATDGGGGTGGEVLSAGGPATGGASTGGGGSDGSGGDPATSGGGGEGAGCPQIPYDSMEGLDACEAAGPLAQPHEGVLECPPSGENTKVVVYEIPVAVGDCVYVRADNAGAEPNLPPPSIDLFDPSGARAVFATDFDCAVDPFLGSCPQGGAVAEQAGTAYLAVDLNAVEECEGSVPYQLTVSVNGSDIPLEPFCSDELDRLLFGPL